MYHVTSNAPYSYAGCSRRAAFHLARVLRDAGACVLIEVKRNGMWREVYEHFA